MFKSEADIAASPLQLMRRAGTRKLTKKSISKRAHTGILAGEPINDVQTSRDSSIPKLLSPPASPFTTTFYLAYPPPHSSTPLRRIKPRLLVQLLQQAATKKRLQPVFEILRTAPLGSRYWQKDVHCRPGDIILVRGDFYSDCTLPDGSRPEYSEDERRDEDDPGGKTKAIAVIRGQQGPHARQYRQRQITDKDSSPARFFFSSGAMWEAITAQIGNHYQLVAVDSGENKANGDYKLISWTRECNICDSGENEKQADVRFCLRLVDRNFQDLPLVATATRQSIEVTYQAITHDDLHSPLPSQDSLFFQSTGRERAQSPRKRDSPFGSLDTSFSEPLHLLCLVLTSAIWVASSEGWLSL